ncbi:hypothetical protein GYA49_04285 [Candidatus Beckwithbacteria bacterium]|nr:hypothetical protein [Candidatus Beckwithbacteria bacterium]
MECTNGQQALVFENNSGNSLDKQYKKPFIDDEQAIEALLPIPLEQDREIIEAKKTMGRVAALFSKQELKSIVTEIKYLSLTWLDEFEMQIFEGKTLLQLLKESGL